MKVDIVAIPRDEGFGLTIVVSVANATDGSPLDGLLDSNFAVYVIQGPSGWSVGDHLKLTSGVFEPTIGVFAFAVDNNGTKVAPGSYTLAVFVKGFKGWAPLHGQTLATVTMK